MKTAKFDYKIFDLEPRDILIYEALLAQEQSASIRLIAKTVNLNRGTTYEVMKKLADKGLVSSAIKNKRKYYVASNPENFTDLAKNHLQRIQEEMPNVESYVAHIQKLAKANPEGQFTQFYDGEEEIAALLRDVLNTVSKLEERTYCVISSAEIRNHLYGKFRNFTKERIKRGIVARVIGVGGMGDKAVLAERRWLSASKVPACYIIIYGEKVAQISLSETGNIQGVVIQNQGMASLHQLLFDTIWSTLQEV